MKGMRGRIYTFWVEQKSQADILQRLPKKLFSAEDKAATE